MSALDLHDNWAWVMIAANGVAGLWALGAHYRAELRSKAFWRFTAAAQVSVFVQAILGVYLVAAEDRQVDQFHMFYGFLGPIAVAIIYSYRHQIKPHLYLLYGLGGFFVTGLGLRALQVGTRT